MMMNDDDDVEQIVDRADPVEQAEFVAEVRAQNKLSSVTFADDYPVEFHNWREFPVYGTKYEVRASVACLLVLVLHRRRR